MHSFRCAFKFKVVFNMPPVQNTTDVKTYIQRQPVLALISRPSCTGLHSPRARSCPFTVPLKTIVYLLHRCILV
jgi:hypothetical protein